MNRIEENAREFEKDIRQAKKQGFDSIQTIEFLLDGCEKQSINMSSYDVSKLRL